MKPHKNTFSVSYLLSALVYIFIPILIFNNACKPNSQEQSPGVNCVYDNILFGKSVDNITIENGSTDEITITVLVDSPNCDNMGNSFKVELNETNAAGITVSGCDYKAMAQNEGSCPLTVHVPGSAAPGAYVVLIKVTVSLRSAGDKEEVIGFTVDVI